MSNFKQAIKWLREGKKVRRPKWNEDSYWEMGSEERICFHGRNAHVHLNQIEEKDWEIFQVRPFTKCIELETPLDGRRKATIITNDKEICHHLQKNPDAKLKISIIDEDQNDNN